MPARSTVSLCKECHKNGDNVKVTTNNLCNDHNKYKFRPLCITPQLSRNVATATYYIHSHKLNKVTKSLERRKSIIMEANKQRLEHIMEIKLELLAELSFYNKLKQQVDRINRLSDEITELKGTVDPEEISNLQPNLENYEYLSWKSVNDYEKELFKDVITDLNEECVHSLANLNEHIKELLQEVKVVDPIVDKPKE
jgi:hypothetical protein